MHGYRRDIDGLRAAAVAPVVLFHAGAPGFSGGFVGVDIFFVISGFLITGILVRDIQVPGAFLARFYDRRIRRIFPALLFMLAATSLAAVALMLPYELRKYGKDLVATFLFVSNIAFFREWQGYFGESSDLNPLLHMWSLAVEEQFYLVFPLALWGLHRLRLARLLPWILLGGALASLALATWLMMDGHAKAAFYLLPSRAWELLLGAWLAVGPRRTAGRRVFNELLGAGGLILIAYAVFALSPTSGVPGLAGLIPCLGAALVIWSGRSQDTWTVRLLSTPAMVGLGLISYSLYLWHWPLLVLPRVALMRDLQPLEAAVAVGLATLMATVSWRYVERPFRRSAAVGERAATWSLAGGATATALGLATASLLVGGLPGRLPQAAVSLDQMRTRPPASAACFEVVDPAEIGACLAAGSGAPKVILWGDSHAMQYADALASRARRQGLDLRVAARGGCPPMVGVIPGPLGAPPEDVCLAFNESVLKSIADDPSVRSVILAGRWVQFFFPPSDSQHRQLIAADRSVLTPEQAMGVGLGATIRALHDRPVEITVIGQSPEFEAALAPCLARAAWGRLTMEDCRFRNETLPSAPSAVILRRLVDAYPRVRLVDPTAVLCPGGACGAMVAGHPMTWDTDHLTAPSAARVAELVSSGLPVR